MASPGVGKTSYAFFTSAPFIGVFVSLLSFHETHHLILMVFYADDNGSYFSFA
jgi:hypothetical protein